MTQFAKLNFYQRLHVRPTASCADITAVYREITSIYRASTRCPKSGRIRPIGNRNSEIFRLITQAYRTLSKPERRARYDRMLIRQQLREGSATGKGKLASMEKRKRTSAHRGYDTPVAATRKRRPRSAFSVLALTLLSRQHPKSSRTRQRRVSSART